MQEHIFKNRIYYRTNEFKPNRLTLVFVHGLSGSSSAWFLYEKIFENKYNVLTFDIRGHGKSKKFPNYSNYEIKHFVHDIHDLILYLNISKYILISHSFATLIALEYIKLYRENVLANILLSPIVNFKKKFSTKILQFILKFSKFFNLFSPNLKSGYHIDYSKYPNSTDWSLKRCYADVSNTTLRVYLYCLKQSLNFSQEYLLGRIKIPTLIIHGTKDSLVSVKNSIIMSQKIKKSELLFIPNANHIIVLNNLREISEAIESFIKKHKSALLSS